MNVLPPPRHRQSRSRRIAIRRRADQIRATLCLIAPIISLWVLAPGCQRDDWRAPPPAEFTHNDKDGSGFDGPTGTWCTPPAASADGTFTGWSVADPSACHEFSGISPMVGKYALFYVRFVPTIPAGTPSWVKVKTGQLHLLNDWRLRTGVPICSAMYNLFQFTTGFGTQHWEVRVYGDGTASVLLNNEPIDPSHVSSGYRFGPSPNDAADHTQFEFIIDGVATGELKMVGHDPAMPSVSVGSGPVPDCDDPDGANVAEPMVFTAMLGKEGMTAPAVLDGVTMVVMATPAVLTTQHKPTVILHGRNLDKVTTVEARFPDGSKAVWPHDAIDAESLRVHVAVEHLAGQARLFVATAAGWRNDVQVRWGLDESCKGKQVGAACDDGKSCTATDRCAANGSCAGVVSCPATACATGVCLADGGCGLLSEPVSQQKPCDDGNACTTNDVCGAGVCAGANLDAAVACDDNNACTTEACDVTAGCVHSNKAQGAPCSDGDACTDKDTCDSAGSCQPGPAVGCDDDEACTKNTCDAKSGCVFVEQVNGMTCDDGSKCTVNDGCSAGKCTGDLKPGMTNVGPCQLVSCDNDSGVVTKKSAPDGKGCDDGDPATFKDTCEAGVCAGVEM